MPFALQPEARSRAAAGVAAQLAAAANTLIDMMRIIATDEKELSYRLAEASLRNIDKVSHKFKSE